MIVALAIGLALGIQAFVVKPYQIPSGSMEPTLEIGQRVLVNRLTHQLGADPEIGDVVVFHPPVSRRDRATRAARNAPRRASRARPARCNDPRESEDELHQAGGRRARATRSTIEKGIPIVNGEPFDGRLGDSPCRGTSAAATSPNEISDARRTTTS